MSTQVSIEKKNTTGKLRVMFYSVDSSPGHSISDNAEKLFQRQGVAGVWWGKVFIGKIWGGGVAGCIAVLCNKGQVVGTSKYYC